MPYAIHHGKALVREIHLKPFKKWAKFAVKAFVFLFILAGTFSFALLVSGAVN